MNEGYFPVCSEYLQIAQEISESNCVPAKHFITRMYCLNRFLAAVGRFHVVGKRYRNELIAQKRHRLLEELVRPVSNE